MHEPLNRIPHRSCVYIDTQQLESYKQYCIQGWPAVAFFRFSLKRLKVVLVLVDKWGDLKSSHFVNRVRLRNGLIIIFSSKLFCMHPRDRAKSVPRGGGARSNRPLRLFNLETADRLRTERQSSDSDSTVLLLVPATSPPQRGPKSKPILKLQSSSPSPNPSRTMWGL